MIIPPDLLQFVATNRRLLMDINHWILISGRANYGDFDTMNKTKTEEQLQFFAAAALQGLLANPNVINRDNIHLEDQDRTSEAIKDVAYRALVAAVELERELSSFLLYQAGKDE